MPRDFGLSRESVEERADLRAAVRIATRDPEFARLLISDPGRFRDAFALTDQHVSELERIRDAGTLDLAGLMKNASYDA